MKPRLKELWKTRGGVTAWVLVHLLWTAGLQGSVLAQENQPVAEFDRCLLENGRTLEPCRIGYRTFGRLNPERNNAVLVLTWFLGTSQDLEATVGPDRMLDPNSWFIIAVDAFGNGVSSSPSNTSLSGDPFPEYSIRDMVRAQKRLVERQWGIKRLHAVVGYSMGGMQALEWAVTYPDSAHKVVSISGPPQPTSYDLLAWNALLRAVEAADACPDQDAAAVFAPLMSLLLTTPEHLARKIPATDFPKYLQRISEKARPRFNAANTISQIKAMLNHDLTSPWGGTLEGAAERIRAQVLIIASDEDHIVRPETSLELARLVQGEVVRISSDCGHKAVQCESGRVDLAVRNFLASPPDRKKP